MRAVYKLPTPYITKKSVYPDEFLTIGEFAEACEKNYVEVKGKKFKKGKGNRGKLQLYLADDPTNISRPLYVEFKGVSSFGVTKYQELESEGKVKDEKEKSWKADGSWSIVFSVEENPKLLAFCERVDKLVQRQTKNYLPKIYEDLCNVSDPKDYPVTAYRKAARATASSTTKYLRLTIPVGKTEFGDAKTLDEWTSLGDFEHDAPGPYRVVAMLSHIDVSFKEDVVSIGPIMYAKVVRTDFTKSTKKRCFRDDIDPAEEGQK